MNYSVKKLVERFKTDNYGVSRDGLMNFNNEDWSLFTKEKINVDLMKMYEEQMGRYVTKYESLKMFVDDENFSNTTKQKLLIPMAAMWMSSNQTDALEWAKYINDLFPIEAVGISKMDNESWEEKINKLNTSILNDDSEQTLILVKSIMEQLFKTAIEKSENQQIDWDKKDNYNFSNIVSRLFKGLPFVKDNDFEGQIPAVREYFKNIKNVLNELGTLRNKMSYAHGSSASQEQTKVNSELVFLMVRTIVPFLNKVIEYVEK